MNRRLIFELLVLSAVLAIWYHLGPQQPDYTKCVFAKGEQKVLTDCESTGFVLHDLEAQGSGALALDFTQKMVELFESELKGFNETAPFAESCPGQTEFYWLRLQSITAPEHNVVMKQVYMTFPSTSMDGQSPDDRIPLINGGAAADKNMAVSTKPIPIKGHRVYVPRLSECNQITLALSVDLMELSDEGHKLHSLEADQVRIDLKSVEGGHITLQTAGMKMVLAVERMDLPELAHAVSLHRTYSYDNKLILVRDLFNRSMATRLDFHQLVNLNSAFVIDFHNKVLPLFIKGSPEMWNQTVSDFNFILDSGLLRGAFNSTLHEYYIN